MSFPFCVDSSLTGADAYLIVGDGRLKWREEIPEGMWTLSLETRSENCLRTLLELDACLPELSVPEKYVTSMKEAMGENFSYGEVPWRHVLPPSEYKRFLTGMVKNVQRALDGIDTTYYTETFSRVSGLFESLDYPAIDVPRLEAYLKDPKTVNTHTLASFKPVAGSFARKARYERVGTRTGRLKMKSGPDMLTLKKDYRNVVTTRHAGGRVLYVDFASLEARVLLSAAGKRIETRDVYTEIGKELLPNKSRSIVKLIVIATVYGSHQANLGRLSGLSEKKIDAVMTSVKEMFAVEQLRAKLLAEWKQSNGRIRNFYGRSIVVPDENTLINSFAQSTGVDVALLGFDTIVKSMKAKELKSSATLLCHDAIIIDAHPAEIEEIRAAVDAGSHILGMDNVFFLDIGDLY